MIVKVAENANEILDNIKLRDIIFVHGQNVPLELEHDGLDEFATLIIAYDNDQPVGCGRYRIVDNYAKIERIGVIDSKRGLGLGKEIMEFIELTIKENTPIEVLKLNSQLHAAPFYDSLGYSRKGELFMDAGIEHIMMYKMI